MATPGEAHIGVIVVQPNNNSLGVVTSGESIFVVKTQLSAPLKDYINAHLEPPAWAVQLVAQIASLYTYESLFGACVNYLCSGGVCRCLQVHIA